MIAKRNTSVGDRLDVLVTLDQNGLQPRDLFPFKGSRNRVHEVLNRRRLLTFNMIWRHEGLIPAEPLIKVGQEHAA
jgi:HTH-type transcriptional regulator / antitoxin HigA